MIDRCRHLLAWASRQLVDLTWFMRLWLLAPVMIWFSYSPVISLGGDSTMNYELSLTLIYVVILSLAAIPVVIKNWRKLIDSKPVLLITIFVTWTGLTVIWSDNVKRGILTFGVVGALYLIFLATMACRDQLKWLLPYLVRILIGTTVIMCLLAIGQMIAGTYIEARSATGLCVGCVAGQFGFVRPNLFAIEPQFLGSLLLAPTLIILYRLIRSGRNWKNALLFILFLTTLGLTLSRGAIYAFIVGVIVLAIVVKKRWLNKLATVDLMLIAAVVCLAIQGGLAAINPTIDETFWGAITKTHKPS